MGACPSADATVKPLAVRPVLLSYTNAAPTVINAPRIIPNKIRVVRVSLRSASKTRAPRYGSVESDRNREHSAQSPLPALSVSTG
jgi:hypothetical protein